LGLLKTIPKDAKPCKSRFAGFLVGIKVSITSSQERIKKAIPDAVIQRA
jgi:hypothetical protein